MRGFCRDGKPIVVSSDPENHWQPSLEKYRHHPGEAWVPSIAEAKEEMKRFAEIRRPEKIKLTVGSLYVETQGKRKKQDWLSALEGKQKGLTVGDLSGLHRDKRGSDELYQGPAIPQPTTSPSQDIAAKMIQKCRKKNVELRRIRDLIFNL
jgi:hypothetical protein